MFSIRKILFTVLLIGLTGGCSAIFGSYEGDEPARYTELRFEDQKPIKLKVSKVDVISEFTPSFRRPNVEHLFPISIEKTAKTWARDRLEAVDFSSDKVAQFIIKDASVTEELETTDKVFERDRMKYRATLNVVIRISDPQKLSNAETEIQAWRELIIPADTDIAEKEKYWNGMVTKLFDEFNLRMERNIHQYLNMYVQDSNYIQDAILRSVSKESEGGHNMFMVGDVKQSIYSFRLARPELFLEKYHGYQQKGEEYQLIELRNNFRSRSEVLTFVNDVFYQIMHEDLGNIEYTQNVALVPTMEFEQGCDAQTELLLLESNEVKDSEEDAVVLEARMIATRIHEMIDGEDPMMVTGKDEEGNMILRKAKYSDIVILLRSMKTNAEVIQKELMNAGIPAFANNQKGYFDTVEIRTLLSLLSVVDNIYMDIDLAAVLRSPMIGMSEEELGRLKVDGEKDSLYECLCETKDKMEKSKKALELLDLLRDAKTYLPLTQLIWLALEKSGYYHYAGAMPQGKKRQGNILMLVEHAKAFESSQIIVSFCAVYRTVQGIRYGLWRGKYDERRSGSGPYFQYP